MKQSLFLMSNDKFLMTNQIQNPNDKNRIFKINLKNEKR